MRNCANINDAIRLDANNINHCVCKTGMKYDTTEHVCYYPCANDPYSSYNPDTDSCPCIDNYVNQEGMCGRDCSIDDRATERANDVTKCLC